MSWAKKRTLSKIFFSCALAFIVIIILLYLYNIIKWGNIPDYGFGYRAARGIGIVGLLTEPGRIAGMEVGDQILIVNGKTYKNAKEFRAARRSGPGENNTYLIERRGQQYEVTITNTPYGVKEAFKRSGLPYLVGICYVLIGVLVFLMKPHHRTSWIFFLFTTTFGLLVAFFVKMSELKPDWLGTFHILINAFTPAVLIHLAMGFPQERNIIKRYSYFQFLPYFASFLLFLSIRYFTSSLVDTPRILYFILIAYFVFGVLTFLSSCFQLWLASQSEIVKLRSKMILLGAAISASIPLLETLVNTFFHTHIVPSFSYYLPFFIVFPGFVGYSIVKHNLFDIDTIIKRTYGYILTTGSVAGVYGLVVLISNVGFSRFEITKSPLFPLIFVLAVIFLFNPIRNRVQKFIDRVFYRLEYDYQEMVQRISESMRSLLNLDQIKKKIVDLTSNVMFIDSVCVMLFDSKAKMFDCLAVSYASPLSTFKLPADDPFFQKLGERKKEVTIYDIQEDPFYEKDRETFQKTLERLEATLVLPLIYENRLTGLISLGKKKSGKYYRREDINLLKTLANQGAVAFENAKLADQMKTEETVRANLARYLSPQIVDQVIKKDVQVNLGGDKKVVTVLFSDIRNFTRITETLPPDQLIQLLNEYFTEMAKIIFEKKGSLDKYIGDAIVAVFGSLVPLENPAHTAVETAVQMMKQMVTLNERWKSQYGFPMEMGIGINTGEVFLGNVGSPERMEFTVIGDTVNIASRFSGLALGGQILITKETLTGLGPGIQYKELPPTEVKGKTEKLEVFEIAYR